MRGPPLGASGVGAARKHFRQGERDPYAKVYVELIALLAMKDPSGLRTRSAEHGTSAQSVCSFGTLMMLKDLV
jgi:hypothetical protein